MVDGLSVNNHIMSICKAANFQLFRLSRIRKYLTLEVLCIAVYALISSRIDYCNSALIGLPLSHISKLQHIMNCAAHFISGARRSEHITPVLESLHWLPIYLRIHFKIFCLVFRALHGQARGYSSEALVSYVPSQALRSNDKGLLAVLRVRTKKFGERAFAYAASYQYNPLPSDIRP